MPVLALRPSPFAADWSDRELLARVLRREEPAWNELVRRYRALITAASPSHQQVRPVRGQRRRRRGVRRGAALAGARRHAQAPHVRPRPAAPLGSWIGIIAVNAGSTTCAAPCAAAAPTASTRRTTPRALRPHFARHPARQGALGVAQRDVGEFSDKDRQFLDLFYARGLEAEEVAAEMKISLKTVYSKNHKIRSHLRCLSASR
jgi:RNA polymerase sigma-70 factor (ECF subfamily)